MDLESFVKNLNKTVINDWNPPLRTRPPYLPFPRPSLVPLTPSPRRCTGDVRSVVHPESPRVNEELTEGTFRVGSGRRL